MSSSPETMRDHLHLSLFGRAFLFGLLGFCLVSLQGCGTERPIVDPPVIIIDIDTLRADHLGAYGYHRPTSPGIDAFSREAVRFDWAFSQAPNTGPSQASILTSLYPSVHGRIAWEDVLPDEVVTLAEVLKEGGYATAAFVDGGMMAAEFGYAQGFDVYEDAKGGGVGEIDPKARRWLRDRLGEPFLLFIHTYDVHAPYGDTPEPYRSMFLEGLQKPTDRFIAKMALRLKLRNQSRVDEPSCPVCLPVDSKPYSLTDTQVEYAKALYDGGIRHVDAWFSEFMDFLEEHGIYDEAIIVIISDHGDEFEEHDAVLHDRIYSPVTRIPFLIRFPGGRYSNEFSETVQSVDLMPTLLDAVAQVPPSGVQGQSLLPLIRGTGASRRIAATESPFHGRQIALATADRRLIYTVGAELAEVLGAVSQIG